MTINSQQMQSQHQTLIPTNQITRVFLLAPVDGFVIGSISYHVSQTTLDKLPLVNSMTNLFFSSNTAKCKKQSNTRSRSTVKSMP